MKLYNTLTRRIEDFSPRKGKKVHLFVCGPTVYDFSHLGHAKTYVQMDTLARSLKVLGYDVDYLQNITDIDDKIIARASEQGVEWNSLTKKFEDEYHKDMMSLNNTSVTTFARATDYIPQIISQVERLIDSGRAYKIENDGIYFEISTFADYGKLSGRREVKEDDALTRIDESDKKRGWNDFALWKFSKPGEPLWDAPFGAGRPGWHIEDTAITEHFFGPQYDIHGGAVDLIFPHHEAELTQMEALSGKVPFVKYWVHAGFLNIDSAKMSKSKGNFFTIREVIEKGYDPMAIRLFILQSHYRSEVNFTWDNLDQAQSSMKNLQDNFSWIYNSGLVADQPNKLLQNFANDLKRKILEALSDDINTVKALSILHEYSAVYSTMSLSQLDVDATEEIDKFIDSCKIGRAHV